MNDFDVTLCKFYDNEICYNEECPIKYCEGYQCIYKELSLLREHCKFIDETNKILNKQKESLLKENEELRKYIDKAGIVGIIKVLKCLDDIEDICKKSWHDSGITIDYFKRNNYSWKQHQIRSLISRFEQIIQKIKEVKGK